MNRRSEGKSLYIENKILIRKLIGEFSTHSNINVIMRIGYYPN
jgi:hypothetical protein